MPRRGGAPTPSTPTFTGPVPTMKFEVAKAKSNVPRLLIYAVEKFGKTTIGAFAPNPIIFQVRDTGYQTLLNSNLAPAVPAPVIDRWEDMMALLDVLAANPQGHKTLVIDGITGAERLCQEYICETMFKGDWSDSGFMSYKKGYDQCVPEWVKFLAKLDRVKDAGVIVIVLGHARTKEVKNPLGANYDRYEIDSHEKTWGATAKWADAILFGKFHTIVDTAQRDKSKADAEKKGKATGGKERVLFTQPHDAFVAGNRYGMDSEIWLFDTKPEDMWNVIAAQIWRQKENVAA